MHMDQLTKPVFYASLALSISWLFSDWQSVYAVAEIAAAATLCSALLWRFLVWAEASQMMEAYSKSNASRMAPGTQKAMLFCTAALLTVSAEFVSSRVLLPHQEKLVEIKRTTCSSSGPRGYLRGGSSKPTSNGKVCVQWSSGGGTQVGDRLDLDDWPALEHLEIGSSIEVQFDRQDSLALGKGAWYRISAPEAGR